MEELILFIIFIIYSVLRSLAESRQAAGQRPVGKPGGLPMPPGPARSPQQTSSLPPEYLEAVFAAEALKKGKVQEVRQDFGQIVPASAGKQDMAFKQDKLLQFQAATLLQGIVYAEVLGSPRAKKPWQYQK